MDKLLAILLMMTLTLACRSRRASDVTLLQNRDPSSEIIYFVVTDRFADGDSANNRGSSASSEWKDHGFEPTHPRMFHGGDLKGLLQKLDYIQNLGATAIWLTPFQENQVIQGGDTLASSSAGYHGYWIKNFLKVDPHLGTDEDLERLVNAAHQKGLKVFADFVFNHTADIIRYRECIGNVPAVTCPFKPQGYTPVVASGLERAKTPEWLNDTSLYHNQGSSVGGRIHPSDFNNLDKINGDISGLDDLKTEDKRVQSGLVEIYNSLITRFRFDGVRVDTVRHAPLDFWATVIPQIKSNAAKSGISNFYIFAEAWDSFTDTESRKALARIADDGQFDGILDFSFQKFIREAASGKLPASSLKTLFTDDQYYGQSPARKLVTFTGNHDLGRIATLLRANGVSEPDLPTRVRLTQAFQLLSRGVPVLYYGDEQGFAGDGGDASAREDMFASRVPEYLDNKLIGTSATHALDSFNEGHRLFQNIRELIRLRQNRPIFAIGSTEWVDQDNPNLAVFKRCLKSDCAIVAFNFSGMKATWENEDIAPWDWKIL